MSKALKAIINGETLVPLGIVAAIVIPILSVLAFGGWAARDLVFQFNAKADKIEEKLAKVDERVDTKLNTLNEKVDKIDSNLKDFRVSMNGNLWTYPMMQLAFLDISRKNPKWIIPDYQKIHEDNLPPAP